METYWEHHVPQNNETSTEVLGEGEVRTLSLLTLADLAVALQDQGDDHNYARLLDLPHVSDEQCLIGKEKDHNYSTRSKTELRGRAKSIIVKRCSSEENLTTFSTSDCLNDNFSPISKKSNSCEQVVALSCTKTSHLCHPDISNSNNQRSLNKLCSSLPKENTLKEFVNDSIVLQTPDMPNVQNVCDHTYARGKELFLTKSHDNHSNVLFQTEHNYDIRRKFSFNNPRKLDISKTSKALMKKDNVFYRTTEQYENTEHIIPELSKNILFNFDHNYTYRHSNQGSGSIESLDMDLSESETDSCEETEQEGAQFYNQMISTQLQDHPYSKSGILSF